MDRPPIVNYVDLDPAKTTANPIRICKGLVLLFVGKDVPVRRYASFVASLEKRFKDVKDGQEPRVLIGHRFGIMRAVSFADFEHKSFPLILSVDGSDLSEDSLCDEQQLDLQTKEKQFLIQHCIDILYPERWEPSRIANRFVLFRNSKSNTSIQGPYTSVTMYDSTSKHYPFDDKVIVNDMIDLVKECTKI